MSLTCITIERVRHQRNNLSEEGS